MEIKYISNHTNEYFSSALGQTLTSNDDPDASAAYQQRKAQKLKARAMMMIKHTHHETKRNSCFRVKSGKWFKAVEPKVQNFASGVSNCIDRLSIDVSNREASHFIPVDNIQSQTFQKYDSTDAMNQRLSYCGESFMEKQFPLQNKSVQSKTENQDSNLNQLMVKSFTTETHQRTEPIQRPKSSHIAAYG